MLGVGGGVLVLALRGQLDHGGGSGSKPSSSCVSPAPGLGEPQRCCHSPVEGWAASQTVSLLFAPPPACRCVTHKRLILGSPEEMLAWQEDESAQCGIHVAHQVESGATTD